MKRLLLASSGIGALRELVAEPAGLRLLFVPTAAGPEPETKWWVQLDRRQLAALGCEVSTLDLTAAGPEEVEPALAAADGVFLTGGNAWLLLWHARRSGFAELVVPLVDSGDVFFAGTSAGAVVAGPDLTPAAAEDNRAVVPELESSRGLGLAGFRILPHDQEPERAAHHDALVEAHPGIDFVRLADDRAVVVRGEERRVVDSPHLA